MRRLLTDESLAQRALTELVGTKKPPRRRSINVTQVRAELEVLLAADDFENMKPTHLVALWVRCHEKVYGVTPAEMNGETWLGAGSAAAKLVRAEFGGSMTAAVEFMRWTWRREQWREKKARHDGENRVGHIGWRLQFVMRHLLTDYRIDVARRRGQ
jgi:hypothetical protein